MKKIKDIIDDIENNFVECLEVEPNKITLTKENLINYLKRKYNLE